MVVSCGEVSLASGVIDLKKVVTDLIESVACLKEMSAVMLVHLGLGARGLIMYLL